MTECPMARGRMRQLAHAAFPIVLLVCLYAANEALHGALRARAATDPASEALCAWGHVAATLMLLGAPLAVLHYLRRKRGGFALTADDQEDGSPALRHKGISARYAASSFVRALALSLGLWLIYVILQCLFRAYAPGFIEGSGGGASAGGLALALASLVSGCIVAPLVEEGWFRGTILPSIARVGFPISVAVVVQGMIFGMLHVDPLRIACTMVAGIALGAFAVRRRSWIPGVFAHALLNAPVWSLLVTAAAGAMGWGSVWASLLSMYPGAPPDAHQLGVLGALGAVTCALMALALARRRSCASR